MMWLYYYIFEYMYFFILFFVIVTLLLNKRISLSYLKQIMKIFVIYGK